MSTFMSSGAAWLKDQLLQAAGVPVTITRGLSSVTLSAVPSDAGSVEIDQEGIQTISRYRDWIVAASALQFSGTLFRPVPGDQITQVLGGMTYTFAVCRDGGGETWRWSDASRTMIRIHTKEIHA